MEDKIRNERAEDEAAALVGRGELLEHLFSYLMGNAVSEILTSNIDDNNRREACYHKCLAITELKASLTTMAGNSTRRRKTGS